MLNTIKPLITFLLAIAGLLFIYSIIQAGNKSITDNNSIKSIEEFSSFLSSSVIIIGGVLSTNLGAVLGVTLSPPHAIPTAALMQHPNF